MGNILSYGSIVVKPAEILQVISEDIAVEALDFSLNHASKPLPTTGTYLKEIVFTDTFAQQDPAFCQPMGQYVSQQLSCIPLQKHSLQTWLSGFALGEVAGLRMVDLDVQNRLRLQLLLAVLGQHRILLLRGVEQIDDCGAYLWQIKYFLLRLKNPLLQPAFVVCDTDIAPRMAFSVERLLVVENGLVETVAVEF